MKKRTVVRNMFYGAKPKLFEKARELRENMTPSERKIWEKLNKGQLGVRFKAQHPIERFIADFYCHKFKLVIEIDGRIHDNQQEYDLGRTAELEKYGIKVLRFTNDEVDQDIEGVLDAIKSHLS
jgi:very-short-patch-repair endonuclease